MTKAIPGYEGLYEADSNGIIWSLRHPRTGGRKALNIYLNTKGYPHVTLHKDKVRQNFRTHRIIAKLFIPNPNNLPEVNHLDGNKQNNSVSNLEWCTGKENVRHSFEVIGRQRFFGEENAVSKLTQEQVKTIWYMRNDMSRPELARRYNVTATCIYNIHKQLSWKWLTGNL